MTYIRLLSGDRRPKYRRRPYLAAVAAMELEVIQKSTAKTGSHDGLPAMICQYLRSYFGACTTIRVAVMVKVPLMLGMGLPSRS